MITQNGCSGECAPAFSNKLPACSALVKINNAACKRLNSDSSNVWDHDNFTNFICAHVAHAVLSGHFFIRNNGITPNMLS
ncbi:hypothetical protein FCS21_14265 [Colwellia ponticola]|uniref:Uncharacterized protein n=1 Tax=Colwellia ponticola TaxID=2304625 RepID=A0A8H2JK60_9GAMM|nr:hypothetical protein FCS21_14265 [Colwellia ponticola]